MFVLHNLRMEELRHQAIAVVHRRTANLNIAVAHQAIAVVVAAIVALLIAVAEVVRHEALHSAVGALLIRAVEVHTQVEEIHEVDNCSTI